MNQDAFSPGVVPHGIPVLVKYMLGHDQDADITVELYIAFDEEGFCRNGSVSFVSANDDDIAWRATLVRTRDLLRRILGTAPRIFEHRWTEFSESDD